MKSANGINVVNKLILKYRGYPGRSNVIAKSLKMEE